MRVGCASVRPCLAHPSCSFLPLPFFLEDGTASALTSKVVTELLASHNIVDVFVFFLPANHRDGLCPFHHAEAAVEAAVAYARHAEKCLSQDVTATKRDKIRRRPLKTRNKETKKLVTKRQKTAQQRDKETRTQGAKKKHTTKKGTHTILHTPHTV